jgi:probable HAF family extracellular repeat protein
MKVLLAMTASCLLLCCVAAAQASYDYKSFQNPGATVTRVFGLNGHGELVGTDDSLPGRHAFLLNHDSHVVLDSSGVLGTHTSFARGINNLGDIVGGYFDDDDNEHGFLLRHGTLTTIDVPFAGSVGTQLDGLNDSGIIVGVWVDSAFTVHGFIYQNASFAHLDYPGALDTYPYGINSRGDIVGNWDTDQSTVGHGFVFSSGRIFSFDVPDAVPEGTAADSINERGQIVGSYIDLDGNSHGFLVEGSTFTTLDCPGANNTAAWGIDSAGQIAGTCDAAGQRLGFLANPRPMKKP